jgi:hypothetical protein
VKLQSILALALFSVLAGCLSKETVQTIRIYRPELSGITAEGSLGTRPLRFDGVRHPVEIDSHITWRKSATELHKEDVHLWARQPAQLLDERLRDLIFGYGGFREVSILGGPSLQVQLVVCEGDVSGPEALAVVELILDLEDGNDVHHRTRLRVEEPLQIKSAEGLAEATGQAISDAAQRASEWMRDRLSGR